MLVLRVRLFDARRAHARVSRVEWLPATPIVCPAIATLGDRARSTVRDALV
jgi:hypothetical protein